VSRGGWVRDYSWLDSISDRQRSVIIGTLFGDAHSSKPSKNGAANVEFEHGVKQREWAYWKYLELKNLCNSPLKLKNRSDGTSRYGVKTRRHPLLDEFRNIFYPNGKKTITKSLLNQVDNLALAVWFGDDGNFHKGSLRLILGGITEQEVLLVREWIGLPHYYRAYDDNTFHLAFRVRTGAAAAFRSRIEQHVPPCMRYKIGC